jgi:CheY-like chemotaxis protein/HPt (histidine-containing phosphotransfer) domain-containing protein
MNIAAHLLKPIAQSALQRAILTALGHTSADGAGDSVKRHRPQLTAQNLRILVAEDNPVNQKVVVRMLEKLGHLPTIAHNGQEALSLLEAEVFDFVFMDVQMPEIDGLTATRRIRAHETQTGSHIPIIAMTAHAMKGDKERCLEAGMDGYLSKPISSQRIGEAIARILGTEHRGRDQPEHPILPRHDALWDPTKALQKVDGDEQLLHELVQIFLNESPKQMQSLEDAIETGDPEKLERTAHNLKGELGYLGLSDAARKALALESMGQQRSLQSAAKLFTTFQAELSAVCATMRAMLNAKHGR